MFDVFSAYLKSVPWTALISSPYGSFHKPNHSKRVIIYCDGETMRGGGFTASSRSDNESGYRVDFAFRKKVSATQWFMEDCAEIPKSWRKEHVSFFAGSRIFNMACVTSSLPNNTSVEIDFAPEHPFATNLTRWAEINVLNLHYASLSALEMSLQWFHTRTDWVNDRELRFFLGHDGSQWFVAGANSTGLCAFHQVDHPYSLGENVDGFYVTINPEMFSQISYFAPGREDEAASAVSQLKTNYFEDVLIDERPFGSPPLGGNLSGRSDQEAVAFLSALLPRRITHV